MPSSDYIDPLQSDVLEFNDKLEPAFSKIDRPPLYHLNESYIQSFIDELKAQADHYNNEQIIQYFKAAQFRDKLILYLVPSDDNFVPIGQSFKIDFCHEHIKVEVYEPNILLAEYEKAQSQQTRHLLIRVRYESLWQVVVKKLPWEDLSIGFQCRIHRKPDIYNSDFWYYFTNVYIAEP
jgi:hypothetical protein